MFSRHEVRISDLSLFPEIPCDWLENRFISCEELFPTWEGAREVLTKICDTCYGFKIQWCAETFNMFVLLQFNIREAEKIPKELVMEVCAILDKLNKDYLPDMSKFIGEKHRKDTEYHISQMIESKQRYLTNRGARTVKDELAFRLGVRPFSF